MTGRYTVERWKANKLFDSTPTISSVSTARCIAILDYEPRRLSVSITVWFDDNL